MHARDAYDEAQQYDECVPKALAADAELRDTLTAHFKAAEEVIARARHDLELYSRVRDACSVALEQLNPTNRVCGNAVG